MSKIHPIVQGMNMLKIEREILDIFVGNGMDEDDADEKIDNMSDDDKTQYLSDAYYLLEEE